MHAHLRTAGLHQIFLSDVAHLEEPMVGEKVIKINDKNTLVALGPFK